MRLIDADEFKKQIAGMAIVNNYPADKANKMCELIDGQPTAYEVDKVVERLENCVDSTTFRYDKETGVLYEVEADVWARIADGTEVVVPIKSGGIE